MKKNLDSTNIPLEVQELFPEKVAIYDTLRNLEAEVSDHMQHQILSTKEDLISGEQAKVKRHLNLLVQVNHGTGQLNTPWSLSIEGRLDNGLSDDNISKFKNNYHLFSYFTRVKFEFLTGEYPNINWVKASMAGN